MKELQKLTSYKCEELFFSINITSYCHVVLIRQNNGNADLSSNRWPTSCCPKYLCLAYIF